MPCAASFARCASTRGRSIEDGDQSGAQLFVLQQLDEAPADSLNALADRTATHQSSVSVVVRRLVDRGYVSRTASAADKRRVEIALTPTGRGLLAEAPLTIQSQLMTAMHTMAHHEQTALAELLERRRLHAANIDIASPPMLGEEDGTGAPAA